VMESSSDTKLNPSPHTLNFPRLVDQMRQLALLLFEPELKLEVYGSLYIPGPFEREEKRHWHVPLPKFLRSVVVGGKRIKKKAKITPVMVMPRFLL